MGVEEGKADILRRFRLPQPQGADGFSTVTDDGHVIGYGHDGQVTHADGQPQVVAAQAEGVAEPGPVIGGFRLLSVCKGLLEQAVSIAQAIAQQRDVSGCGAVKVAGGQPAQAAVAKGIVFYILKLSQVDAFLLKQFIRFLQHPGAIEVIENHPSDQVLHRQIEGLLAVRALFIVPLPLGRDVFHQRLTQRLVQLPGFQRRKRCLI